MNRAILDLWVFAEELERLVDLHEDLPKINRQQMWWLINCKKHLQFSFLKRGDLLLSTVYNN